MNAAVDVAFAIVGLVLLARAADLFVDGAVGLSRRFGVAPVIVGAVVIGLGTSLPELLVSVIAAIDGDASLGVGNVVGSNIANLSLVLGVAALLTPIAVSSSLIRREAPMSVAAVALFALAMQGGLTRVDGALLLAALAGAVVVVVRGASPSGEDAELVAEAEDELERAPRERIGLITVVGLVGTVLGAQLLVEGATGLAGAAGLSEGFVGVTLVAIGTSLPELVTAAQAARRGEDELIVGNVLGSNLFNSLLVGGAIALIGPGPIDDAKLVSVGAIGMTVVAVVAWILMGRGRRINRPEAALLLVGYATVVALLL